MKNNKFLLLIIFIVSLVILAACDNGSSGTTEDVFVDYVSQVKLERDFTGKTFLKDGIEEVKLDQAVDGDTIHVFNKENTQLKLRFVSVDTPESTSSIEPWGKAAANFTKSKVSSCVSLVITSEDGKAGSHDSYERWLAFVWYKPSATEDYRLLNLELIQESYSISKSTGDAYHDEFVSAAAQARKGGKRVWGETDTDYCYDGPKEVSLMEIRTSLTKDGKDSTYLNKKVVFDANVVRFVQTVGYTYYLTDTDLDSGESYAIQAYAIQSGTGKLRQGVKRVRISGTIVYYEAGDTYQLTDIVDLAISKNNYNLSIVDDDPTVTPMEITAVTQLANTDKNMEYQFVELKNLNVTSTYTTSSGDSRGAMTIDCTLGGKEVTIRTAILIDKTDKYIVDSNNIVLASNFTGKTIDVIGIVEKYDNKYQIKVVSMNDIVIH